MPVPGAPATTASSRRRQVLLANGATATIRALGKDDRPAIERLFAAVRPDDLYTRFFTVGHASVARHLDHLFGGGTTTTSYVLERGGLLLGLCDLEQLDTRQAEIALLVADGAHGLGIGTLLLEHAAEEAWTRGITTLVADVLAVNHPMVEVFTTRGRPRHPVQPRGRLGQHEHAADAGGGCCGRRASPPCRAAAA